MEITHLGKGSTEPVFPEGTIKLYSMRFCPYAHRAHLALNAKGVNYTPVYINLSDKPDWYLAKFPAGRVPALSYKGEFLYESLLLAEFVNEEFPGRQLYQNGAIQKIKDKLLIEDFGKISTAFYKAAMVECNEENIGSLLSGLAGFEAELCKRGTIYFGGNESPLMLDYMIWPWFERFGLLEVLYGKKGEIAWDKYPSLTKWVNVMKEDSSIQEHYLTAEQHGKHFKLRKENDQGAFNNTF